MAAIPPLASGELVGGSHKVVEVGEARLVLANPGGCLLGCGLIGLGLLALAGVTWVGLVQAVGAEGPQVLVSKAAKGALIYTGGAVLGLSCLTLIERLVIDGAERSLTRVQAFGLRRRSYPASALKVAFVVGAEEQGGLEPCRVLVHAEGDEQPVLTLGALAATSAEAARLLAAGERIAGLLGLELTFAGRPRAAHSELRSALEARAG